MYRWVMLLFGLVVSLSAGPGIDPEASKISLAPVSSILVDTTGDLGIDDVVKPEFQKRFTPFTKEIPSYGYSDATYWIRVSLSNESERVLKRYLNLGYAALNHVIFFENNGTAYQTTTTGTWYPVKSDFRGYAFPITLMPESRQDYYLQVKTLSSSLTLPLSLWKKDALLKSMQSSNYFLGLAMGAIAVIALYNLFLFFVIRDTAYLYYVGYAFTMFMYEASNSGISNLYFWPGNVFLNTHVQTLNVYAMNIFALAFSHAFLGIQKSHPMVSRMMKFSIVFLTVIAFLGIYDMHFGMRIATVFVATSIIFLVALGIHRYVQGYKPARYYLLAWGLLAFGIVIAVLRNWGVVPTYPFTLWLLYWIVVFETVFLSFALADRITLFRREKETAQQALMENQRTMQATLEKEVREKTAHLEHALDERETLLQELNHRVKNNMQLIVSLLRLQARDVDDERLKEKLAIAENRINAMGKLHELLYRQGDILHLDTATYLGELIHEIKKSSPLREKVVFHIDVTDNLPAEKAIYVGLIVNEMVSNALKYAFDEKGGNIEIRLAKEEEGGYILYVRDDGSGFDPAQSASGLGRELIFTLARNQLFGEVHHGSGSDGTWYEVRF